jgi:hypothetical protein
MQWGLLVQQAPPMKQMGDGCKQEAWSVETSCAVCCCDHGCLGQAYAALVAYVAYRHVLYPTGICCTGNGTISPAGPHPTVQCSTMCQARLRWQARCPVHRARPCSGAALSPRPYFLGVVMSSSGAWDLGFKP